MTYNDTKLNARRKFKAAVYAACLTTSVASHPAEEPRVVGKKFHPRHAACLADREVMRTLARRKFRAAVFTIIAIHELQEKRANLYIYYDGYAEPVYEWEDTVVPVTAKHTFKREVSLELEDLFGSEEAYLRKLAKLKHGLRREQKIQEKLFQKWQLQAVALAVTTAEFNRALNKNMHPRNKYRGLEYAVAVLPAVNVVLKSEKALRKLRFQLKLRRKLRAAVYALIATHELQKRLQKLHHAKAKEAARAKEAAKAAAKEWRSFHEHAVLEENVRRKLSWLGSHIPPRHSHHREDPPEIMATMAKAQVVPIAGLVKFGGAVDTPHVKASE